MKADRWFPARIAWIQTVSLAHRWKDIALVRKPIKSLEMILISKYADAYLLYWLPFLLICLQNLQELLVGFRFTCIARLRHLLVCSCWFSDTVTRSYLNFVDIVNCMVKLNWRAAAVWTVVIGMDRLLLFMHCDRCWSSRSRSAWSRHVRAVSWWMQRMGWHWRLQRVRST